MKRSKMHIAGPGSQRAGQWVNCTANVCRLGGVHTDTRTLELVHTWKKDETQHKVNKSDLNLQDLEDYNRLPQETRDAYKEAYNAKIEEANKPANRKKAEEKARKAYNQRQARLGNPDAEIARRAQEFFANRPQPVKNERKLTAREPIEFNGEKEVTATTVTFDDGFVGQRKLYSLASENNAREMALLTKKVYLEAENRALTIQEADDYLQSTIKNNYLKDGVGLSTFRSYLLSAPEDRDPIQKEVANGIVKLAIYKSIDVTNGYEHGTTEAYNEGKASRKKDKDEQLKVPVQEKAPAPTKLKLKDRISQRLRG